MGQSHGSADRAPYPTVVGFNSFNPLNPWLMLIWQVMPKVTINGQIYEAEKGRTIIQVADEVGVQIPRYCYHPDIGIEGSCRMCLVEVKGAPKLMPACATPIADNMEVRTNTERVHDAVRYA